MTAAALVLLAALVGWLWGAGHGRKRGRTEMHQAWSRKWAAEMEKKEATTPQE